MDVLSCAVFSQSIGTIDILVSSLLEGSLISLILPQEESLLKCKNFMISNRVDRVC